MAELHSLPPVKTDHEAVVALLEEALAKAKAGQFDFIILAEGNMDGHWYHSRIGVSLAEAVGYLHRTIHKLNLEWDDFRPKR